MTDWDDLKKNPRLADAVEATLGTDGWRIIQDLVEADRQRLYRKLAGPDTSWEDTIRYRGELQALDRWSETMIRDKLPRPSDTP